MKKNEMNAPTNTSHKYIYKKKKKEHCWSFESWNAPASCVQHLDNIYYGYTKPIRKRSNVKNMNIDINESCGQKKKKIFKLQHTLLNEKNEEIADNE